MYSQQIYYQQQYQNQVNQEIGRSIFKFLLFKAVVALAPQNDKKFVSGVCDSISAVDDLLNPPKTFEGTALVLGINGRNLAKYL